jgi:D-xylose transport system substrate-binding protein
VCAVAPFLAAAVLSSLLVGIAEAKGKVIGVSWSNFQEERWKTDEAALKSAIAAAGDKYLSADAQSSAQKQLTDVESLIAQGVNVLIVLAQDSFAIAPAVQRAIDEGIALIGYDRLIENPNVFYITFDNKEVGRMQARAIFAARPRGNYAFIKGSSADPNADFLFSGQMEVLKDAIAGGAIKNVGESYTDGWLPANAQRTMEQILTKTNNQVDAVVASNDGTAGGAIAALAAQGLSGSVPVSGKDARALGTQAAKIASLLAEGKTMSEIPGAIKFANGPKKVEMNALLLTPIPITKDNLNIVLDAGWVSKAEICKGVRPGAVNVCD